MLTEPVPASPFLWGGWCFGETTSVSPLQILDSSLRYPMIWLLYGLKPWYPSVYTKISDVQCSSSQIFYNGIGWIQPQMFS